MRLVFETNVQDYIRWVFKFHRSILGRLVVVVVSVLLLIGAALLFDTWQPLVRDFYIANYAHVRAGDPIPFTDEITQYTGGFRIDEGNVYTFGMESNSVWVANYVRQIVPYMAYEQAISEGYYPRAANVIPFGNIDSFHVAGRMLPNDNVVFLNERYFLDGRWNDQRRALETLVHELVHIQRGNFIYGTSAELESTTSAATTEVLAAMCNYEDELACKAFWFEVESLARSSLLVQLHDLGAQHLYELWANTFWRNEAETGSYLKAMRFWSGSPDDLMAIRVKYSLKPWMGIIYGTVYGIPLDTGNPLCILDSSYDSYWASPAYTCTVIGMPFDDARYLLRNLRWIME